MQKALGPVNANRLRWEALLSTDTVLKAYAGQRIPRSDYAKLCKAARRLRLPEPPSQPIT